MTQYTELLHVLLTIVVCVGGQGSVPISGYTAVDCREGLLIADEYNMCRYYVCKKIKNDAFELIEKSCPLGTRLPYSYYADYYTPCTYIYEGNSDWECSREKELDFTEPDCAKELVCENGGRLRVKHGACWCDCPPQFQGDNICSRRTGEDIFELPKDLCGGFAEDDFCRKVGGCLNGGKCHDLCGGFWCDCPAPFRWGKQCQGFSCSDDNECYNGGTCDRGKDGQREYRECICPFGYEGRQCENNYCWLSNDSGYLSNILVAVEVFHVIRKEITVP